ncbi:MAG: hypothetical protein HC909_03565 [Blastochloris sp.]|nr:hypothetical protein [Blastochloris sp.]
MTTCVRLTTLAVVALCSAAATQEPARAQDITSSVSARAPASHPLMTPEALAAAEANFHDCLAGLWPQAQRRGITPATYQAVTNALQPDMSLFKLMEGQPEFERPIWWYIDSLVTERASARAAKCWRSTSRRSTPSSSTGVSTATSWRRSGASNPISAPATAWAAATWCAPPPRWPSSAGGRPISRMSSWPRC